MPVARLAGIGVVGFRDLRVRAMLGPWAKLNVLGGANNTGKSAMLTALYSYVQPNLGNLRAPVPQGLDLPQVPNGEELPFQLGLAVDFGEDPSNGFLRTIAGSPENYTPSVVPAKDLKGILDHPALLGPDGDVASTVRWFWMKSGENAADDTFLTDRVGAGAASHTHLFNRISDATRYSGTLNWGGFVQRLLANTAGPKGAVHIPAFRQVRASDHRTAALPGTDGVGLPGMLLSLIAPSAEDFRESRAKLASINSFLQQVLGKEDAELLVPHDAQTVHVALDGKVLPLSHLGAGVEQLVLLASVCTAYADQLVIIEEPDLYLHPTLQRQLLQHLHEKTSNTYFVATHSAAMLDTDFANVFRVDWTPDTGTTLSLVSTPGDRARLATSLGFRASDLVQANSVIWVEGPSDRIYIKHWLSMSDPRLKEGIHFTFVMYGGRLAEHLTRDDGPVDSEQMDRFLRITRINQNAVFVMDSDLSEPDHVLARYKSRLRREFEESGHGLVWITDGVMIENYLDPANYLEAYRSRHPRRVNPYDGGLSTDPFEGGVRRPDKVGIALAVVESAPPIAARGDLLQQLARVTAYICAVNGMELYAG